MPSKQQFTITKVYTRWTNSTIRRVNVMEMQTKSFLDLNLPRAIIDIDLLKERYGKKQVMVNALYAKLINLPVATFKSASLR